MAFTKTINDPKGLKPILLDLCPPDKKGHRSIAKLAKKLGMSSYGIYKWINSGRIPPEQVNVLVKFSKGKLTHQDLHKFVFGKGAS